MDKQITVGDLVEYQRSEWIVRKVVAPPPALVDNPARDYRQSILSLARVSGECTIEARCTPGFATLVRRHNEIPTETTAGLARAVKAALKRHPHWSAKATTRKDSEMSDVGSQLEELRGRIETVETAIDIFSDYDIIARLSRAEKSIHLLKAAEIIQEKGVACETCVRMTPKVAPGDRKCMTATEVIAADACATEIELGKLHAECDKLREKYNRVASKLSEVHSERNTAQAAIVNSDVAHAIDLYRKDNEIAKLKADAEGRWS